MDKQDIVYFVYIDSYQVDCEFHNFVFNLFHTKDEAIDFAKTLNPVRSRVYVSCERDLPDFEYELINYVYDWYSSDFPKWSLKSVERYVYDNR